MGSMTDTKTPGQRFVQLLNDGLAKGLAWDSDELVVLTLIEESADCAELLKTLMAVELAKPGPVGASVLRVGRRDTPAAGVDRQDGRCT